MDLGDGLVLRGAQPDDLDQVCALLAARGDDADAEDLLLVAGDPDEGLGSIAVVVDGTRVVSTATLLRETVLVDDVVVPTGQVEMVATDPAYEGRGLVRSLMGWAHDESASRGDLLQVMIGIPYFYRQFGYSYTMRIPQARELRTRPTAPSDVIVRAATLGDIEAMSHLQDAAQSAADVRMVHSAGCWRWLVQRSGSTQIVAERAGEVIATGRCLPPDEGSLIGELAGDADGLAALLASLPPDEPAEVLERPGTPLDALLDHHAHDLSHRDRRQEWFYARIPSLAPLLARLRPVLVRRMRDSGLPASDVLLSSFRSHVRFTIDEDDMTDLVVGGPEQAPISKGGSGVPPDVLAPLVLGPFGAAGLEARHGDVMLGKQRDVMEALFPPLHSDLLTFYLAT